MIEQILIEELKICECHFVKQQYFKKIEEDVWVDKIKNDGVIIQV